MSRGLPLAWLQLWHQKLRLLVAAAGVAFAVILIFMQLGFRAALLGSATRFHDGLNGDLVLLSPTFDILVQPKSFSRRRLAQAQRWREVAAVSPIYLEQSLWRHPDSGKTRSLFVIGVDPADAGVVLPGVLEQRRVIQRPDVVLFDRLARPEFGPIAAAWDAGRAVRTEINHRRVAVGGLFQFGTSFGIDGSVLTSETNFLRLYPRRSRSLIDVGLIRLRPGVDAPAVRDAMRASFPNDVIVLTKAEYALREQAFWDSATPIGYVFTFGVIIGCVVGGIIVYQILFADVSEHLPEYATLKALGYPNRYLFGVVLQQALILAILGYLPGLLISRGLYALATEATRLPMYMTAPLAGAVLLLTVAMCGASGAIALSRIRSADPAEVF
ncbi:MAG: ABC transporter permease DevC [Candidatus Binatia bacterium]